VAGFVTNRGKKRELDVFYRGQNAPTGFYLALVKATANPTVDTNVWSDISAHEIAAGNGYTANGKSIGRNTTDWEAPVEDDTNDRAYVQLVNSAGTFTASGGPIPASGAGARYAVLLDDNSTPANREVLLVWDLGADRTISDGQQLILQDCERRSNNA
jgi:hypothetical protein